VVVLFVRSLSQRMLAPVRFLSSISGFFAVASLCLATTAHEPPVKAVPELISQRYCSGDAEVFSVWLRLRMTYTNQTDETLILDKEIGKVWYGVKVARTLEDLNAGKYEYNPNIDWFFTDQDKLPKNPSLAAPGTAFAILSPGQSFESEIDTSAVAQYESAKNVAATMRSGTHVFQMELSAWNHAGLPSEFEKSWKKGRIVTGSIKTEPIAIGVPANLNVENVCK
jgi:hypothetical protein